MNPLAVRATNLRTFERLDLELPTGCVVIGGENGAGKSTILNAIDVALFADRGELASLLSLGEEELHLELQFEHAGELYRVRRMYSAKGKGKTTLDFERFVDGAVSLGQSFGWEPLTRETAPATQQLIEAILNLSRTTFRASSFLGQGDGDAFTAASPRDRKQILAEILGLHIYDRLLGRARGELRAVEDETVALRTKIGRLEEEAANDAQVQEQLTAARAELASALERQAVAEQTLEQTQQAHAANAAAVERVRAADAALVAAKDGQERARVAYAAAVQAGVDREQRQRDLDQAAELAATVPALEQQLAEIRDALVLVARREALLAEAAQHRRTGEHLTEQLTNLRAHVAQLVGKADHLDAHIDEAGSCDRCGQTLGAEAAARAAASFRTEASETTDRLVALAEENTVEAEQILRLVEEAKAIEIPQVPAAPLETIQQQLNAARAAGERRATLAEQVRQLAEQAALQDELALKLADTAEAVTLAEAVHGQAAAEVADDAQLRHAVANARGTLHLAQRSVTDHREAIARLEVAEQRVISAAAELVAIAAEVETISNRVDVLKLAERAFGRDGIPALIVENAAIPQLEVEANRILGELGGATADCRVELRTQRLLKTTEALRETLDIVIVTPAGERPYESFSGGERTRLNLSLRIALARLLAHRRGAESRLLAIDEPDGLDATGMGRLADVLQGLGGDFDKILLVSHHVELASAFDQTIMVAKQGDVSAIADDRVEVAA